jgi:hypothetical protein
MKSQFNEIPEELRALPNWVVWRLEKRATKSGVVGETKVPYNARNEKHAKSNDPATWSAFGDAEEALKRGYFNGLGFCLTPPFVGVDLDGCRQAQISGKKIIGCDDEPWAAEIIAELDSYHEASPSGSGIHVIVKGELPLGKRQKDFTDREHHGIGLYDSARGRYLTMTGLRIGGNGIIAERSVELQRIHARLFPPKSGKAKPNVKAKTNAVATDDDLLARAKSAKNGGKFARLWDGQWKGDYASPSEADLALSMILAFWTNRDAGRIDALFRRSGLMRDKWERQDYREQTIAKAIEQTSETWTPRGPDQRTWTVQVGIDAVTPTLDLLNACELFCGRIRFTAVERRGPMIVARFAGIHVEAVWPSIQDLISFSKSRAILAETTQMLIPTPPRRAANAAWEPTAQVIMKLAGTSDITSMDSLRDEFADILQSTWKRAERPAATDDGEFIDLLRACQTHKRNPQGPPPNHCVWHDGEHCYVHQPSLIEWLSTPAARNKQYDWSDVRKALLLLGFKREQIHRSRDKETLNVRLWRGPLELLIDDET